MGSISYWGTHLPGVDLQDGDTGFGVRWGELDFAVDPPRSEEGDIEDVCDAWRSR